MDKRLFSKVEAYIKKHGMIEHGDRIAVGVSGGADSVCLLLMLCELAKGMELSLIVVHVNHGIREEAADDAAYVKGLCMERGLPFVLAEEDVRAYAKKHRLSEEEAGREIRYRAFEEALRTQECREQDGADSKAGDLKISNHRIANGKIAIAHNAKIAIAHNANDRAETMLFHLFRGTGLAGLGGIRPVRGNVIRPLLCLEREEIEAYLKENKTAYCTDATNAKDIYTRNRIRRHILPFAEKEVCRGAVSHMCEAADILLETDGYIRRQAERVRAGCLISKGEQELVLDGKRLKMEDSFLIRQVLLLCLEALAEGRKDITSVHVREIEGLLYKTGSRQVDLPYGLKAAAEYDRLMLYRMGNDGGEAAAFPDAVSVSVPGRAEIPGLGMVDFALLSPSELTGGNMEIEDWLTKSGFICEKSYTKWFDYDRITRSLLFRRREAGDYLTIHKDLSKKTLKSYMIEKKIPKNQRKDIYILAEGQHVLWVPGYRVSEYYKISNHTKHILQVHYEEDFKCQRESES